MSIDPSTLPSTPAILRVRGDDGSVRLAIWNGSLRDLSAAADARLHSLDALLTLSLAELRPAFEALQPAELPEFKPETASLLAPVEGQEVWAAGVTYRRSREARMEEAAASDIYALVYEAARPELFFKAAGWRVVAPHGEVGVRADSLWDVPEPELAVLSNRHGEVVAYACGNDMSSRSIEGENPLYLPQAKVYDASCSLGPAAVLAWHVEPRSAHVDMTITRGGSEIFKGRTSLDQMVRSPADLVGVMHAAYTLPTGAWLLTGTGIVPPSSYTARAGDDITIAIDGVGTLQNRVRRIEHSGAAAPPRIEST